MLIICGKTASGKTSIVNKLISLHDFKQIVTYTTREMRKDEKQDITYHYISEKEFKHKIQEKFFAEWKSYNTEFGTWYYGSSLEDLNNAGDKSVIILTPEGYRDVRDKLKKKPVVIYIYANNATIKNRLLERKDNEKEADRRLKQDNEDFKGFENEVDKIIYNNNGVHIEDVANKILECLEKRELYG